MKDAEKNGEEISVSHDSNHSVLLPIGLLLLLILVVASSLFLYKNQNHGGVSVETLEPGQTRDGTYKVNTVDHTMESISQREEALKGDMSDVQRLDSLLELGYSYLLIGQHERATEYANEATSLAQSMGDENATAELLSLKEAISIDKRAQERYGP